MTTLATFIQHSIGSSSTEIRQKVRQEREIKGILVVKEVNYHFLQMSDTVWGFPGGVWYFI